MKNIILLGIVVISFASSCKRHRACVCTTTSSMGGIESVTTDNYFNSKII